MHADRPSKYIKQIFTKMNAEIGSGRPIQELK